MNRARLFQSRLFWPIAGLALLLLFNLIFDRSFFEVTTRDGNLYGPMLTILRVAVKVMLLSIGMTLVIATGGVDLSVGSVMAIVGALVASLSTNQHLPFPTLLAVALGIALIAGSFNGALQGIRSAAARLEKVLDEAQLGATTASFRESAGSLGAAGTSVSDSREELQASLVALREALESVRTLADSLERDPSVLLRGPHGDGVAPAKSR